ncbi:50S ribosomal protein L24 [Candidatus Woesearchaeota archaeon]|nr:50S ribosomal protein L24 [Candidatus Woesearchaeota archaeon]
MKLFSLVWKSSKKPSKQRKYRLNAPLHLRRAFLTAQLSGELARKYSAKRLPLRAGDTVRVMKGEFRSVVGKVNNINLKLCTAYVDGAERVRKDGTKSFFPLSPSNLLVTELNVEDKRRASALMRKSTTQPQQPVVQGKNPEKKSKA